MKKKATIRDIAREAGVSDTTVSLALRENSRISWETRQKIQKIARKLRYFPNLSARNLRSGGSNTIGFIVTDITDPFYSRMIRSAERIALELGYNVLFAESNWEPDKEIRIVSNMIESRVKGLIICFCEKTEESLELIHQANLHYITVDTYPAFYKGPYVINDVPRAGYIAAQHLVEVGCRYPVFFNASESMISFSSFKSLARGFKRGLRAHSIDFDGASIINSDLTIESGRESFHTLLAFNKKFDGILCVNDLCAFGAIDAAEQHGYKVGENLAVMGIDNIEMSSVSRISLTSIDQPYNRIIELATKSLIESIEQGVSCSIRTKLEPQLIVRESTRIGKTR